VLALASLPLLLAAAEPAPEAPAVPEEPAAWPEVRPGRPSFSDTAATTERGAIGVDLGGTLSDGYLAAPVMLRYGVTEGFDLRLGLSQAVRPSAGLDDLYVMAKVTLVPPEEGSLGFAISPWLSAPTPLGDELVSGGVALIATWPLGGDFQLDANVLASIAPVRGSDARVEVDPVVAFGFPLAGPVWGWAEAFALLPGTGTEPSVAGSLGLGLEVAAPLWLDLSATAGEGPDVAPWSVQLGGTFELWGPGAP